MKTLHTMVLLSGALALASCGPNGRNNPGDDTPGDDAPDAGPSNCTPTAATETSCTDGFDNDCNHYVDCEDTACVGTADCPVETCEITTPSVSFPLPDGDCTGSPPIDPYTDAQMQAFLDTCGAYDGSMDLSGFPANAMLTDTSKLLGICVNMEHSWLRDMQIEAYAPDNTRVVLSKFQGQDCPSGPCEVFLGVPVDEACDGLPGCTPEPGTGYDYCWTTAASNLPMIDFANAVTGDPFTYTLPAGDYQPSEAFTGFANVPLNGTWRIRVVDGWGIDNGFIFSTKLMFDPSLSDDCPIIE